MPSNSSVEALFAGYTELSKDDRAKFDAMKAGFEFTKNRQAAAGEKAGSTRRQRKARAAAATQQPAAQ